MTERAGTRTQDEWMNLIMECRQSGMTDKRWCELKGINTNSFYNAIKRLRRKACDIPHKHQHTSLALVEIPEQQDVVKIDIVDEITPSSLPEPAGCKDQKPLHLDKHHTIEIELNGAHIRVTNDVNPALLSKTISLLRSVTC